MAEFLIAFPLIMRWESMTWTDIPHDKGGETYCGISRVSWGHIPLWQRVDYAKTQVAPVTAQTVSDWLIKDDVAQSMMRQFYHDWWNRMRLSDIKSQKLANFVFQFAVNVGEKKAARLLQMMCVTNGRVIGIDGQIGLETITAINTIPDAELVSDLATMQRHHYIICRFTDRTQNIFKRGWEARVVDFLKEQTNG